jgi:hypothetical protein
MRVLILAVLATLALAAPAAAAPQWLQPVDIAGPSEQNMLADVSVAANGTTLVVFTEFVNGFERVRARVRPPGGGFGPVMELSPADKHGSAPSAAIDGQGNFTVAFTVDDPTTEVRAARLPAGAGAFEGAETVSTGANALEPEIAVGANGTAVIVYLQGGIVRGAIRNGASGEFNDATMLSDSGVGVEEYFVAVDDGGTAVAAWSRDTGAGTDVVEASVRPANAGFPPPAMVDDISLTAGGHHSTQPALAMAPDGRTLVLWTHQIGAGTPEVQFNERQPSGGWMPTPGLASKPFESARSPGVAIAGDGSAVGSWIAFGGAGDFIQAAVRGPGGAFTGHRPFASTTVGIPNVVGNRAGDTMVAWGGSMGEGVFAVRRPAGGDFGSVDTVGLGTQGSADPAIALILQELGVDDQGNAAAVWRRGFSSGSMGVFNFTLQAVSYDAAPPSLDAVSVPPAGAPGSPIGMAATASDRLSTPAITWNFGDGTTGSGPAVSHAYGAAGAYSVTVSATDGAGNTTSTSRSVVIVAPPGAAGPPRITSPVRVLWGVNKKRIFLLRMKALDVPRGGKAELRCKGKKCPYKRKSSKKRRKGDITLFKEIKPRKVVGKKQRTFRAGQTLQLRITAPGHIGKVVKYRLRKGRIPSGQTLCLRVGGNKPRKNC